MEQQTETRFRRRLLEWYAASRRSLPWRESRDPYRIWLSEIMLQQTRVAAVVPYYERFLARFPVVEALASAPLPSVLTAWSGLGYYSRARNLHAAAKEIARAGRFPEDYDGILALPGVGPYTAAAIASIAFGLPHAVVDGNVLRALSRVMNEAGDIRAQSTKRRLGAVAERLLARETPGEFNQALMELGAVVCLPKVPRCGECPVRSCCQAHAKGTQDELPVKLRRTRAIRVVKDLLLIRRGGRVLLRQNQPGAGMLGGFWELPEAPAVPQRTGRRVLATVRHTIMNRSYVVHVVESEVAEKPLGARWQPLAKLEEIPLSTLARKAIRAAERATGSV